MSRSTVREILSDPLWQMVAVCAAAAAVSAIGPEDWFTWAFELGPGTIGVAVLVLIRRRFRFSPVAYRIIALQYIVLAVGAHYTYEQEPTFSWLRDHFHWKRNHFDRVGHFLQGLTPALLTREVLIRRSNLRGWVLAVLSVSFPVTFSACYEILEWQWVVWLLPAGEGEHWLGMQGDLFDAQADMLMALMGALVAVLGLARLQDKSIAGCSPTKC